MALDKQLLELLPLLLGGLPALYKADYLVAPLEQELVELVPLVVPLKAAIPPPLELGKEHLDTLDSKPLP